MKIGNHARANNLVVSSFLFLNMEADKINGRDYGFFGLVRAFTDKVEPIEAFNDCVIDSIAVALSQDYERNM